MDITLLYLMLSTAAAATVNVLPNRSQFFGYESISLSCEAPANSSSWKLKRNTTSQTSVPCNSGWGMSKQSSCFIEDAYPSDTGIYWCESERGCSDSVNITVTVGKVILESPVLPVTEGQEVELLCSYKDEKTKKAVSHVTAKFFKDGAFIGSQPTGKMRFPAVSSSNSGLYKCEIPLKGESPQSWMDVTAHAVSPPLLPTPRIVSITLLVIVYIVLIIVCVKVHHRWAQARAEAKKITFDDPSRK